MRMYDIIEKKRDGYMKIKLVTDSAANLYEMEGIDFEAVPLKIITDKKEYVDNISLDVEQMVSDLGLYKGRSGTACPNVGDWLDAFDGYYVTLNPYVFSDIEEMDLNKMYFCISVGSAEDYISFDLPGGEALSILSAIAEKVTEAITFLRNLIEILIGFITAKA